MAFPPFAHQGSISQPAGQGKRGSPRAFNQEYDLVTAHYASIQRTNDGRGIDNLLAPVAPGGTLLVVGDDIVLRARRVERPSTAGRSAA